MLKRILLPGILGFVVLAFWTFVMNGLFGFNARLTMNPPPDEVAVYEMLKERIVDGGVYISNPQVDPDVGFPFDEPVFSIQYSGFGHEAAGRMQLVHLAVGLVSMLLAATLLSLTSARVQSRYAYRVLFVMGLGVLLALFGDVPRMGIGGQPIATALLFAGNRIVLWTLVGLVMAWATRGGGAVSEVT